MSDIMETEKNETNEVEKNNTQSEEIKEKTNDNEEAAKKSITEENTDNSQTDDNSLDEDDSKKKRKKKKRKSRKEKMDEEFDEYLEKVKSGKADMRKPEDINIVKDLLWLIVYIGIVILICFAIIKFVGCRSRVDGDSMNDTLYNGDNLWVDKLSYTFGDPKRFDIIIFNPNPDTDPDLTYVKRIIGLPGETVYMDNEGRIYIGKGDEPAQLLDENFAKDEPFSPDRIGIASINNPIVLGEDEYFVLGDNRNNSSDSRFSNVGNVKRENIVGKVVLRIYPFSRFGLVK